MTGNPFGPFFLFPLCSGDPIVYMKMKFTKTSYFGHKVEDGVGEHVDCGPAGDDVRPPPPVIVLKTEKP